MPLAAMRQQTRSIQADWATILVGSDRRGPTPCVWFGLARSGSASGPEEPRLRNASAKKGGRGNPDTHYIPQMESVKRQSTLGNFGPRTSSASTMVYAYPCSARNLCRCAAYSVSIVSRDTTV